MNEIKKEFTRICPCCGKLLEYKSYAAHHNAVKRNDLCRSCAGKKNANRCADLSILLEDTPESWYWIGFLLADGCFSKDRLTFTLKKSDSEQVHKFGEYVKYTGSYGKSEIYEKVSCKDLEIIGILRKKYNIKDTKTYNPPENLYTLSKDALYCILAGFIDGDGYIKHPHNRQDFTLSIKTHKSWLPVLELFNKLICEQNFTKINNAGYAVMNITNTKYLQELKQKILTYNLPLLSRKWDIIDLNFVSRYTKSEELRNKVLQLLKENVKQKEIAQICGVSASTITKIKKNYYE